MEKTTQNSRARKPEMLYGFLIAIGAITLGMGVMALNSIVPMPEGIHPAVRLCILFLVLNLVTSQVLKLRPVLLDYWSARKMIWLPVATVAGALIAVMPAILQLGMGMLRFSDVEFCDDLSFASMGTTLLIVSWEELWFRGIFLNYCVQHVPVIAFSLGMGLLFMLMHAMNPEVNLLHQGAALTMAGAFLTAAYFRFKSIWIPIGLHLGNNYFGCIIRTRYEHDVFWGGDGYVSAVIMLVGFVVMVWGYKRRATFSPPPK